MLLYLKIGRHLTSDFLSSLAENIFYFSRMPDTILLIFVGVNLILFEELFFDLPGNI